MGSCAGAAIIYQWVRRETERANDAEQHDIEVGLEVKMSLQYTRTKEISLYE